MYVKIIKGGTFFSDTVYMSKLREIFCTWCLMMSCFHIMGQTQNGAWSLGDVSSYLP